MSSKENTSPETTDSESESPTTVAVDSTEPSSVNASETFGARKWYLIAAIVLCLVVLNLILYGDQLSGHQFTNWDDNWLITDNTYIREASAENIRSILDPRHTSPEALRLREALGNEYLPVRDFSYMLDYHIAKMLPTDSGIAYGYQPGVFATTNLLLHLINVLLVCLLTAELTRSRMAAVLAALVFSAMPIHVEVVSWMSSRKDLLASMFVLFSLLSYIRLRKRGESLRMSPDEQASHDHLRRSGLYVLSLACFLLAMLSKTPAIVLPGLLVLVEVFHRHALARLGADKVIAFLAPFFAFGLGIYYWISKPIASNGLLRTSEPYGGDYVTSTKTVLGALIDYPFSFIAGTPVGAVVDAPIRQSIDFWVILAALVILLSMAYAAYAAIRAWKTAPASPINKDLDALREVARDWEQADYKTMMRPANQPRRAITRRAAFRVSGFGIAWILAAFIPVCNLLIPISTVYADRYAYLPSVGWAIAVGTALTLLVCRLRRSQKAFAIAAFVLIGLWLGWQSLMTWSTVPHWKDSAALWEWVLERDPENHTALYNQGLTRVEQARNANDPKQAHAYLHSALNSFSKALEHPARTYRYDKARVYTNRAQIYVELDEPAKAIRDTELAEKHLDLPWRQERGRRRVLASIYNARGSACALLNDNESAIALFKKAKELEPQGAGTFNLARLLKNQAMAMAKESGELSAETEKNFTEAKKNLQNAADLQPDNYLVYFELAELAKSEAETLKDYGESEADNEAEVKRLYLEARENYKRVVDILRESVGTSKLELYNVMLSYADVIQRIPGDEEQAVSVAAEAFKLFPDNLKAVELQVDLLKYPLKRFDEAEAVLREALKHNSNDPDANFMLAEFLIERGETKEALDLLRKNHDKHPDHEGTRDALANAYLQTAGQSLKSLRNKWIQEFKEMIVAQGKTIPVPILDAHLVAALSSNESFKREFDVIGQLFNKAEKLIEPDSEGAARIADFYRLLGEARRMGPEEGSAGTKIEETEYFYRESYHWDSENVATRNVLFSIYMKWLELMSERVAHHIDQGEDAKAKEAWEEMWRYVGNMALLSDQAREILAQQIVRLANSKKVPVDDAFMVYDANGIPDLPKENTQAYSEAMQVVIRLYEIALVLQPGQKDALDQLNAFYRKTGDFSRALETLRELDKSMEDNPVNQRGVRMSIAQVTFNWAHTLEMKSEEALKDKDQAKALEFREQALAKYLEAKDAWLVALEMAASQRKLDFLRSLGICYQKLSTIDLRERKKWLKEAIATYIQDAEEFPFELVEMHKRLADMTADRNEKIRVLKDALPLSQGEVRRELEARIDEIERSGSLSQARELLQEGKPREALEMLDREKLRGESAALLRGECYEKLKQPLKAAMAYNSCTANADAQIKAGKLFLSLNDNKYLGEAYSAFGTALKLLEVERMDALVYKQDIKAIDEKLAVVDQQLEILIKKSNTLYLDAMKPDEIPETKIRLLEASVQIAPGNFVAQSELAVAKIELAKKSLEVLPSLLEDIEDPELREKQRKTITANVERYYRDAIMALSTIIGMEPPTRLKSYIVRLAEVYIDHLIPILDVEKRERDLEKANQTLIRFDQVLRHDEKLGNVSELDETMKARVKELREKWKILGGIE